MSWVHCVISSDVFDLFYWLDWCVYMHITACISHMLHTPEIAIYLIRFNKVVSCHCIQHWLMSDDLIHDIIAVMLSCSHIHIYFARNITIFPNTCSLPVTLPCKTWPLTAAFLQIYKRVIGLWRLLYNKSVTICSSDLLSL